MHEHGRRLLLPAVIVAAAALLLALGAGDRLGAAELRLAVRGALLLAFALAWRFRCGRAGWSALLVAVAIELPGLAASPPAAHAALALLLPIGLAIFAWLPEGPLGGRVGLGALAGIAVGAVAGAILEPRAAWLPAAARAALAAAPGGATGPSAGAVVVLALAVAAVGLRFALSADPIAAGLLAATFTAGAAGVWPSHRTFLLGAGGLALAAAVVDRAFQLALEDALTGLPSRRALEARLRELGGDFAIAMVDLDRFKLLNDRHGHAVGDQALRWVAKQLRAVGGGGEAFRYGGEEFAVVFPQSTAAEARPHAEELRQRIAEDPFALRGPGRPPKRPAQASRKPPSRTTRIVRVTISIGLAGTSARRRRPRDVLAAADRALYRAKRAGRNRVAAAR